ncbi:hypothetical protein C8F04DRAFT_1395167 [Mycena alexandri]|uniref:FAD/NAD(P)-binding domain-containing protein n=1 Tax=Mycena alexandri TaxID=1745969 RepID=A0AAD6X311_9AGAR|nr:hypothetical protein C8F04DRAFT_1395167 [Mycena alexandri]
MSYIVDLTLVMDNLFLVLLSRKLPRRLTAEDIDLAAHPVPLRQLGHPLARFPRTRHPHRRIAFDYAVYALGSHLPLPLDLSHAAPDDKPSAGHAYNGNKAESIAWLKRKQAVIESTASVLIVGGGALGIQFAADIAAVYPAKLVTLLHSRARLLPRFDSAMHTEILQVESMNVKVILAGGSTSPARRRGTRSCAPPPADDLGAAPLRRPNTPNTSSCGRSTRVRSMGRRSSRVVKWVSSPSPASSPQPTAAPRTRTLLHDPYLG